MSKVSAGPRIVRNLVKSRHSVLDPKIRLHKTDKENRLHLTSHPKLDSKIRIHVVKDVSGFSLLGGKHRVVTGASIERLKWEKLSQKPEGGTEPFETEERASPLDQTQTQTSQPSVPELSSSDPVPKSAIKALAQSFEARKTKRATRNNTNTTRADMSSQLTKVLTKDACPRKSNLIKTNPYIGNKRHPHLIYHLFANLPRAYPCAFLLLRPFHSTYPPHRYP